MTRCPVRTPPDGTCDLDLADCACQPCPKHDGYCSSCPLLRGVLPRAEPRGEKPARLSREKAATPLRIEHCGAFVREYSSGQRTPDELGSAAIAQALAWLFGIDA